MRKIQPKKAAEAPIAAALMAAVLMRQGKEQNQSAMIEQAKKLEQIARENEKTPQGKFAPAIRKLLKVMRPKG